MTSAIRYTYPVLLAVMAASSAARRQPVPRPPVIDVHLHAVPGDLPAWARADSQLNIRYRVASVLSSDLGRWSELDSNRVRVGIGFPCDRGRAVITGFSCQVAGGDFPDTTWLRAEIKAGRVRAFTELVPQYSGISPADPRLEPYYAMAEEFDLPVGIHMGSGPPNAAYEVAKVRYKSPAYRAAFNDPMLIEEVLLRHKRLRVWVMHAGWPMLESMIALLYAHPNVNVDVGVLQREELIPRPAYDRHLRGLVEAGFAKRIMFGSDSPAASLKGGIDAIAESDFLTAEQKSDILCGNAQRFLRLPASACQP